MKGLFSVAVLALALHSAGSASAAEDASEPTPAQVRTAAEAFDRGREAYKSEDYVEAAEQFESADSNAPSAAALELAIRARDKAGQLDRAATLAALALARHPDDPNIQKIAPAIVERAKAELFELDLKCDEPCEVTIAGKLAPGRRATDRKVFLSPGTYAVRAGWADDRSSSKSVDASKGAAGSLDFVAPGVPVVPVPVAPPVNAPSASERPADGGVTTQTGKLPQTAFWVGVGLTAVLSGVTIWSGLDTQNNPGADKVRDACKRLADGSQGSDCETLYNEGLDKQHRTNLLLGVTAGVGVATAVVGAFFTNWGGGSKPAPDAEEAARARGKGFSIQPWLAIGSGASVGALGRF